MLGVPALYRGVLGVDELCPRKRFDMWAPAAPDELHLHLSPVLRVDRLQRPQAHRHVFMRSRLRIDSTGRSFSRGIEGSQTSERHLLTAKREVMLEDGLGRLEQGLLVRLRPLGTVFPPDSGAVAGRA